MSLKRGPKPGRAHRVNPPSLAPAGLGDCPAELDGLARELWTDAAAHLEQTGRGHRVYRTPLRIACRLVGSLEESAGLDRIDACRRWLAEMGLTVASAGKGGASHGIPESPTHETGRAKLFRLLDRKAQGA
jgi:hypothetical protein